MYLNFGSIYNFLFCMDNVYKYYTCMPINDMSHEMKIKFFIKKN